METIAPRRAPWRELTVGSTVWTLRQGFWCAATVTGLGKNHGEKTIISLSLDMGGKGRCLAGDLYWRKPELNGQDKPPLPPLGKKRSVH